MKWFADINSLADLRSRYKQLLIKYHPDNNPGVDTTKEMQEINSEYDTLLKQFTDNQSSDSNFSTEKEMKRVLNEAVKIKADITIEVVGTWIWIAGNTYAVKAKLKELGFKWASKKKMWHWGESVHRYSSTMEMEDIRAKYGTTVYRRHADKTAAIE